MFATRKRDFVIALLAILIGVIIGIHMVKSRTESFEVRTVRHQEDIQRMLEGDTVTKKYVDSVAVLYGNKHPHVQAICRDTLFYSDGMYLTRRLCHDVLILDTSSHSR